MSTLPNPKTGVVDEEKGGSNGLALTNTTESTVARRTFNDHVGKVSETFSFQNICYTVPMGGGAERRLLDDVSGYVVPGKLLALVGESGAGKTTLLNVLAHRVKIGVITGDCYLGGNPLPSDFQAQAGYCQQMDVHLPAASVREALLFSAKLRQPRSVSAAEREAYVELCLKMCGLAKYADAIVGTLNIEFRKRTTIAVELVAKPSLIFVDEPTTGLDSRSAWAILQFLRELADHGQAIVCTIHQPSAELFQTFDSLLLLRKGGQTVYYGDLGHNCSTLLSYFERNGARHCGDRENPAEYMLEVVGAGATATTTMDWHEIWAGSPEAQKVQANLDNLLVEGRKHHRWKRSPRRTKLALNVVGGLLVGFTFFKSKYTIQGTQNQLFAIFISTVQSIALAHQLEVAFLEIRSIYEIRERYSRMYSWTALVTAQLLVEVPWNILGSSLFFLCWYWTVGFPTSRGGFVYFMLGIVWPLYYTTMARYAVAAMSPDAEIAGLIFGFLVSFIIIFNGVLQPFRLLGWWKWMYHVSPFTYLIEALLGEATGRANITCSAVELVTIEPPSGQTCLQYMEPFISTAGGYITNPTDTASCHYCFFATTDAFLETNFNILYSHHWRDFGLLFVYIGFNTFATYFFTYIFRIRTESYLHRLWRRAAARMASKQPKPEPDAS
ncbi:Brefeldin A resistance protein [Grifola frondosa]|uniref:Brefeldin A resistance protein n=1 Tax=Grifola frondosa TaxID=5627 RepID=A0A1C7M934_GRIFR|nr:Brefeldin A resistance protein [Grifola frondosa]